MTAPLQIVLLGGFKARAAGQAIEVPGRKERALLAFLAMPPGEPRSRDRLAGLLWSERADKQAHDSLKQAVLRLRKSFNSMFHLPVLADREFLTLDRAEVAVDVGEFEQLIGEGTPEAMERAATLYRGDLLDGLDVRDPAFEEWLLFERQRLRDLARKALATLLDRHMAAAAHDQAGAAARRLLALDPLREIAHRALMRIYAEQGQTALALKQYQQCRDTLQGELGVKPEPETTRLYKSIRQRRATPVPSSTGSSSAARDGPPEPAPVELPLPSKPSIAVLPFVNMSGNPDHKQPRLRIIGAASGRYCCKSILQAAARNINSPLSAAAQLRFVACAILILFLRRMCRLTSFATKRHFAEVLPEARHDGYRGVKPTYSGRGRVGSP